MEDYNHCMFWDHGHYLVVYATVYITNEDLLHEYYEVTLRTGTWFRTSSTVCVLSTLLLHIFGIVNITTYGVVCHVCTDVHYIGSKERDT
jgi:hypothetical protein